MPGWCPALPGQEGGSDARFLRFCLASQLALVHSIAPPQFIPTMCGPRSNYAFASDNTAGVCPEALAAIRAANAGRVPSYGDDAHTAEAKRRFAEVFERECDVFFVFNGTAANEIGRASCRERVCMLV